MSYRTCSYPSRIRGWFLYVCIAHLPVTDNTGLTLSRNNFTSTKIPNDTFSLGSAVTRRYESNRLQQIRTYPATNNKHVDTRSEEVPYVCLFLSWSGKHMFYGNSGRLTMFPNIFITNSLDMYKYLHIHIYIYTHKHLLCFVC